MNGDQNEIKNSPETGINQKFFKEVVEAHLSPERIKEKLGDLDKEWKDDVVKPILTKTDQEKLTDYEKLEVKDLPDDWQARLARLKRIEKDLADYEQKKVELKGWTDIFEEKKPIEIQTEIKNLEEKQVKTEEELKGKITELEKSLETSVQENLNNSKRLGDRIKELEGELKEWTETWKGQELSEIKEEWEDLHQRPDIPITEQQFLDDYARRKSIQQSELESQELEKTKEQIKECRIKNSKLWFTINSFIKNERIRRYALSKPVLTVKQAREAIAELLEQTETNWKDYLENKKITDENYVLDLSFQQKAKPICPEELEVRAKQVLNWIEEARTTLDYETLFERWNGGKKYNEENDYDGGPYLLRKWLEVKEFEVPLSIKEKEEEML